MLSFYLIPASSHPSSVPSPFSASVVMFGPEERHFDEQTGKTTLRGQSDAKQSCPQEFCAGPGLWGRSMCHRAE